MHRNLEINLNLEAESACEKKAEYSQENPQSDSHDQSTPSESMQGNTKQVASKPLEILWQDNMNVILKISESRSSSVLLDNNYISPIPWQQDSAPSARIPLHWM